MANLVNLANVLTDREQQLVQALLGLRERGSVTQPCWCREKDYVKKGKHASYCLMVQAIVGKKAK